MFLLPRQRICIVRKKIFLPTSPPSTRSAEKLWNFIHVSPKNIPNSIVSFDVCQFSSNRPHFPPSCFLSGSCVQTSSGCKACLSLRPPSLLSSTNVFFTLSVFMFSRPRFFESQLRRSIASRSLAPRFSILALAWNVTHNVCIFRSIGFLFTKNW